MDCSSKFSVWFFLLLWLISGYLNAFTSHVLLQMPLVQTQHNFFFSNRSYLLDFLSFSNRPMLFFNDTGHITAAQPSSMLNTYLLYVPLASCCSRFINMLCFLGSMVCYGKPNWNFWLWSKQNMWFAFEEASVLIKLNGHKGIHSSDD